VTYVPTPVLKLKLVLQKTETKNGLHRSAWTDAIVIVQEWAAPITYATRPSFVRLSIPNINKGVNGKGQAIPLTGQGGP
jgi:hypothetical protein